jgi:hypothetical protein
MSGGSGGCGKLVGLGIAALILVPLLITAGSTAFFCRKVSGPQRAEVPAAGCAEESGSPCAAVLEAFEAAAAADTERLRGLLADPAWLERLPPAATSTPEERGQFYVGMLLGEPPASLEALRGARTEVRAVVANTGLDGRSAQVGIEVGGAEMRKLIVEMRRRDGAWTLVPLDPARR